MNKRRKRRLYLSPPHMSGKEARRVASVFRSNWISSVGPEIQRFESAFCHRLGSRHAVALSSGTAAIHLALRALGLRIQDEVLCSTLTFAGSANPIAYESARPVFVDSEAKSWNLDPSLLEAELGRLARARRLPKAVIAVDLYGQCADLAPISRSCRRHGVPLIEDAAEALGASYRGRPSGTFGWANIFSFNGNKIITTSGGGMLTTDDGSFANEVRNLSQQARDPAPHYQHSKIGFNYRMSNVLAAIGLEQLKVLDSRVAARRRIFELYESQLGAVPGITFMPEADYGRSNRWLTCILIDEALFGASREDVRLHLESLNIEARPVWKPMHLQPVFSKCRKVGGHISERLFRDGLCLPSGSAMSKGDVRFVAKALLATRRRPG